VGLEQRGPPCADVRPAARGCPPPCVLTTTPQPTTHPPPRSIGDYKSQLTALGNDVSGNRGKMLYLILSLCQKVEKAFGGGGGGAGGAIPQD